MKKIILSILMVFIGCGACLGMDFKEEKGEHFIVYYKDVPDDFVSTILEFAEKYYNDLNQKLGFTRYDYWTWDKRAKIYIYPDQETYLKETGQPAWTGGVADYYAKTISTFPRDSGFFDTLLPHEIGHIVFREVIGKRTVPTWIEEGVASYLEQAKRLGADKVVSEAIKDNTFIPFVELNKIDGYKLRQLSNVNLFYAEAVSLVNYLIGKFGIGAFNDLCRKIKDGKNLDDALSFAYFDIRSADDLGSLWEKYLKDKSGVNARVW